MSLTRPMLIAIIITCSILLLALVVFYLRRTDVSYRIAIGNLRVHLDLPSIPDPKRGEKILIFAPHEDDETLGAGGLIQKAVRAGSDVSVVLMTNGEYPEFDVVLFEETIRLGPESFIRLGYKRQQETMAALKYLGLSHPDVIFLGYPNGYLNQMWEPEHWLPDHPIESKRTRSTTSPYNNSLTPRAVYCGQSMLADVEEVLTKIQPDTVITLHPNDIHVDHWPTGAVVTFALDELAARGEQFAKNARVYTYLIHRDLWPQPRGYDPLIELQPPAGIVSVHETGWKASWLSLDQTRVKHHAITLYHTQLGSYDPLLQSFARRNDLYGVIEAHEWPSSADVSMRKVIVDPIGDRVAAADHPSADISSVSLERKGDTMTVVVTAHRTAERDTTYHFSIHAGGPQDSDRVIIEYDWVGSQCRGRMVRNGTLTQIDSKLLQSHLQDKKTILTAPWPLSGSQPSFSMVRAWTNVGNRTIDQTAETVLKVH